MRAEEKCTAFRLLDVNLFSLFRNRKFEIKLVKIREPWGKTAIHTTRTRTLRNGFNIQNIVRISYK